VVEIKMVFKFWKYTENGGEKGLDGYDKYHSHALINISYFQAFSTVSSILCFILCHTFYQSYSWN